MLNASLFKSPLFEYDFNTSNVKYSCNTATTNIGLSFMPNAMMPYVTGLVQKYYTSSNARERAIGDTLIISGHSHSVLLLSC